MVLESIEIKANDWWRARKNQGRLVTIVETGEAGIVFQVQATGKHESVTRQEFIEKFRFHSRADLSDEPVVETNGRVFVGEVSGEHYEVKKLGSPEEATPGAQVVDVDNGHEDKEPSAPTIPAEKPAVQTSPDPIDTEYSPEPDKQPDCGTNRGNSPGSYSFAPLGAEQPIRVEIKSSKLVLFICPCGDAHMLTESTALPDLLEGLEGFRLRHLLCLRKNVLPFGG